MLSEIDKDARAIAALQKEVHELREQCVTNLRCIVALEEETRLLKAQQTKDYTHLMSINTHQTEDLGQQETSLLALRKEVRGLQEETMRMSAHVRERLDRMVSTAFKPVLIDAHTGEKVRLTPLEGCPNVFVLQAKALRIPLDFSMGDDHPMRKNIYYSERPCWIISLEHVQSSISGSVERYMEDNTIEHRTTVKTFLFQHKDMESEKFVTPSQDQKFTLCVRKKMVPSYSVFRRPFDNTMNGYMMPIGHAFQPTLIEFVP